MQSGGHVSARILGPILTPSTLRADQTDGEVNCMGMGRSKSRGFVCPVRESPRQTIRVAAEGITLARMGDAAPSVTRRLKP